MVNQAPVGSDYRVIFIHICYVPFNSVPYYNLMIITAGNEYVSVPGHARDRIGMAF